MAMLAEPRRRKRYNLNPRGKALYEDDTRFGTKMLEKMGWSKGKGLGANEDGSKDFVRVRFKNDAEGLGYETRDDQWTVHEEGFNGLLKSLNGGEVEKDNGNASASEEESRPMGFGFKAAPKAEDTPKTLKEKISGVSLEESSKSSKARVHYKKFTRGKDLSRYSEKDLANIFGKKATEATEAPVQVVQEPEEEKEVNPNFAGVQTLQTGLSVQDYFKQKMEAMKNRLKNGTVGTKPLLNEDNPAVETMAADENKEPVKKKKKRKDKELEIAEQNGEAVETQTQSTDDNNVDEPVKKKKNKKSKQQEDVMLETEPIEETTAKKEKKKKSKRATEEESTKLEEAALEQVEDENPPKRKKHKKNKAAEAEEPLPTPELPEATQDVEVKKKKKSKSKAAEEPMQLETEQVPAETEDMQVKKKKKSKNKSTVEEPQPEHHTESLPADSPKKSKKKSKKETEKNSTM
ncbi:PIN2/TERF1-interacting telomerase inhibitor 1 isoform X2 [Drosophila busckii]|uniref:PIN2/TERF1-interacting telomerase inhibitor 1 isoform X2 n=1 Tax=Drosophila busckii TaxID=30019 RepID=UPI00083EDADF|nr:PIN2/TERF1-interacting telomerase inhibitor 1 isoform X2 [Drosophila busckii]